jgi:hypothetical protein
MPLCGFAITVALLSAMRATTIMLGCIWLIIGLGHLLVLRFVFDRSVAVQALAAEGGYLTSTCTGREFNHAH